MVTRMALARALEREDAFVESVSFDEDGRERSAPTY